MAEKSLQEQILEKKADIAKLELEIEKLRQEAQPKYPKHIRIPIPDQPNIENTMVITVESEAEEKAALARFKPSK